MLSESVHKALVATGGEAVEGTAQFVKMFDCFFDCLNVNSFTAGKRKRKVIQSPYRSATDFRLKVDVVLLLLYSLTKCCLHAVAGE